jgi:hypothetical protein
MTAILKDFPVTQTTFEQYVRRTIGAADHGRL